MFFGVDLFTKIEKSTQDSVEKSSITVRGTGAKYTSELMRKMETGVTERERRLDY